MPSSISGPTSVPGASQTASAAAAPKPAAKSHAAAPPQQSNDTVTLSQTAQVIELSMQGKTPSQIASELGIPISTVNSDLQTAATVSTPPSGGAPAGTPSTSSSA